MFTEDELLLLEELVTHFRDFKAEGAVEIRQADGILTKIDSQLNGTNES